MDFHPSPYLTYMICFLVPSVTLLELLESHQSVISTLKSDNYSCNLIPPVLPLTPPPSKPPPLKIFVNLGLRDIENIDDRKMEMKMQLSIRQKWTDPRLQYVSDNPNAYITLNADMEHKPWTPDIFVRNEKHAHIHSITRPNSFFRIYPNGTLYYSTRMSLTVNCYMNLRLFPFDRQTCDLHLASYGYTTESLEILWDADAPLKQILELETSHLAQFRLVGQRTGRCQMKSTAGAFSSVYVALAFKRQVAYYSVQMYIPCTMLVIITWISFWLGNAMEARLSLTVTALLTLSTHITGANQNLAQVNYTTGFSVFTATCLTFAAASIFESATVFYFLRGRGPKRWAFHPIKGIADMNLVNVKMKGKDTEEGGGSGGFGENEYERMKVERIDRVSRIMFPVLFILFLVTYSVTYLWEFGSLDQGLSDADLTTDEGEDYTKACRWWGTA